jgi:two-component system CheB/CheR fusion protein
MSSADVSGEEDAGVVAEDRAGPPAAERIDDPLLPTVVVGVGASAGGLEALERLFRAMPADTGMAFVVVQHLSPDFKSLMDELLERFTTMPAIPVTDTAEIRANTIYLLTPNKEIVVNGTQLISRARPKDTPVAMPINVFFQSLAASWGERGGAIVLSGTGSDGSHGILDVHDAGGLVLVQSPDSARFDGMPQSAIHTGCVDAVLDPEDMSPALLAFARDPRGGRDQMPARGSQSQAHGLPAILDRLHQTFNIDFSLYKPSTITRRIERRVALSPGHETLENYSKRLVEDPAELDRLYRDLLIGVTRFFRDGAAFHVLRTRIIPEIIDSVPPGEEIRVWDCGCSTGEEAYSLAILLLEACEAHGREPTIKVLATDLHEESVQTAAEGIYSDNSFAEMPDELREKYFVKLGDNRHRVAPALRKVLIFSEHNLLKDPPFTKLHLISCRNLLIYFEPPAQLRSIAAFHFALAMNGVLFLGSSETLGEAADAFDILDRQWKIFRKTRESRAVLDMRSPTFRGALRGPRALNPSAVTLGRLYDVLLDRFIPAGFLINERYEVLHIFGKGGQYVQPATGRFSGDLLSMVTGSLNIALSSALRNASKQRGPVTYKGVRYGDGDHFDILALTVEPLAEKASNAQFYMVRVELQAIPEVREIVPAVGIAEFSVGEEAAAHIRNLEIELQKTRESLQSAVEELETSNEELQASNEELLASNEELQSTNEELHSVNEELYSVNAEHELKIRELNLLSSDLSNLIQSTDTATIFVDTQYKVRLFTPRACEVFNFVAQDIGRDLRHFRPMIPEDDLFDDMARVLESGAVVERQIQDGGRRTFLRRCTVYKDTRKKVAGLVLNYTDMSEMVGLDRRLKRSEARFRELFESVPTVHSTLNVLVIEDSRGDYKLVELELARSGLGAHCRMVDSPADLLSAVAGGDWQLILTDYNVPGMDCEANLALFHERLPDVPVIMVSGAVGEEKVVELLKLGVWDYVSKYKLSQLQSTVERCLRTAEERRARAVAEERLHASEAKYRALVEQSLAGIYIIQDTVFRYVNPGFAAIFGYGAPEALIDRVRIGDLTGVDDRERVGDMLRLCLDGESPDIRCTFSGMRPDGVAVGVDMHGRRFDFNGQPAIIGVALDVTERLRAERALRQSQERLNMALTASRMGVWEWDIRGESIFWSPECMRIYGVGDSRVTVAGFTALIHAEDADMVIGAARDALDRKVDYTVEYRIVRPDGETRWVSSLGRGQYAGDGRARTLVGTTQDITDYRNVLSNLTEAKERAEAANLAKSRFLAIMSHELRTPLNAIIGFGQFMRMSESDPSRAETLDIICKSGLNLLRLIQDILDLSKIEAGKFKMETSEFDLDGELDSLMVLFRPQAIQQRLDFSVTIAPGTPQRLGGDPGLLRQILVNLVGNAFKFTRNGKVTVDVGVEGPAEMGRKARLVFQVTDTGVGIRPENQERIFEIFEQEDNTLTRQFGGTGLGLAISQRLVSLLEGRIWLQSTPGVGSRFSFTALFEVLESGGEPVLAVAEPAGQALTFASRRILVAEDDHYNRKLLEQILREQGFEVESADNGVAAADALARSRFDLAIMDIQMPMMSGIEVTQRVRSGSIPGCRCDIPIIAVTAYAMRGDRERFSRQGLTEYVSKPIDIGKLLTKIAQCLQP